MRHFVIGDIHGCYNSLRSLIKSIDIRKNDTIITLGDYIDRGPDSRKVIDYLIKLKKECRVLTLKGNHEQMMEYARHSTEDLEFWLQYGGTQTLQSMGINSIEDVPEKYWEFIRNCYHYYETDSHIFVHAGVHSERVMDYQHTNYLFWQRLRDSKPHISGKIVICGHSPQESGLPIDLGYSIGIDTFAFDGKWLTCLDPDSREYWQANEKGETRKGHLDHLSQKKVI